MQRTDLAAMTCPIARGLGRVGEWWSILILRDAFAGMTRFDEFQKSLGIAPNMLTRRLAGLVEAGLLEKHLYSARPPRHEYRLTAKGTDFREVLITLLAWGNRNFAPEGANTQIIDTTTGRPAEPMLIDRVSGAPLTRPRFAVVPGPAATEATLRRHAATPRRTLLPEATP